MQNTMSAATRLIPMYAAKSDQSSLCAQWVAKDLSFLHANSEDTDQTGRMLTAKTPSGCVFLYYF